jgi:hypothetical protein
MAQRIMSVRSATDPGTGVTPLFSVSSEASNFIGELYQPTTGTAGTVLLKIDNLLPTQTGDLQQWRSAVVGSCTNAGVNYKAQFIGDGSLLSGIAGPGGITARNLLSESHLDTTPGSPSAGALIVGTTASTSTWSVLALAAVPADLGKVLTVGAANALQWVTPVIPEHAILSTSHTGTVVPSPLLAGSVLVTTGTDETPVWTVTPRGDDGDVLTLELSGGAYSFRWADTSGFDTSHYLLSGKHPDTNAYANEITRGDLLTARGASPDTRWDILPVGTLGQYLAVGEDELEWIDFLDHDHAGDTTGDGGDLPLYVHLAGTETITGQKILGNAGATPTIFESDRDGNGGNSGGLILRDKAQNDVDLYLSPGLSGYCTLMPGQMISGWGSVERLGVTTLVTSTAVSSGGLPIGIYRATGSLFITNSGTGSSDHRLILQLHWSYNGTTKSVTIVDTTTDSVNTGDIGDTLVTIDTNSTSVYYSVTARSTPLIEGAVYNIGLQITR